MDNLYALLIIYGFGFIVWFIIPTLLNILDNYLTKKS